MRTARSRSRLAALLVMKSGSAGLPPTRLHAEYEIRRLFADARVLRIYSGTSEIMRELISRNL
ncbi:acyl-CoA dehydrogenase family protein [Bradyrhizobium sp.]|uniref:acyl-CoA dehydrogenase family protein n=1 Tax=Bradyrhizobium sp. TaxID=376 RepID=UPI0025C4455D|nr:acyl-CoA dehydrogenase family protein [Bradyrhizobium sp.]